MFYMFSIGLYTFCTGFDMCHIVILVVFDIQFSARISIARFMQFYVGSHTTYTVSMGLR